MRILVVEDDKKLASVLNRGLHEIGYAVDLAFNGEEAKDMAEMVDYDLIVLDVILPLMDGFTLCAELRENKNRSRIIMLTSRDTIQDRVNGLDVGADDYLIKPFAFDELLARIRALLRRDIKDGSHLLQTGDLCMDTITRQVTRNQTDIKLTAKEYALLEYFMRNPQIIITHRMIEDHVWNFSLESESNLVEVYVRRLRNKIDIKNGESSIETIRGMGYRLRKNDIS